MLLNTSLASPISSHDADNGITFSFFLVSILEVDAAFSDCSVETSAEISPFPMDKEHRDESAFKELHIPESLELFNSEGIWGSNFIL